MSTPFRSAAEGVALDGTAGPSLTRHWGALVGALLVTLVIALALWPAGPAAERRALLRMRPDARQALYAETRRNADALCAQAPAERALRDRCADSAAFLLAFPECDDECRGFARAHRRGPTR